jgi:lipopolysaccharide export LptBFGC system permease protein LptF
MAIVVIMIVMMILVVVVGVQIPRGRIVLHLCLIGNVFIYTAIVGILLVLIGHRAIIFVVALWKIVGI